jgi:hypothetical protein
MDKRGPRPQPLRLVNPRSTTGFAQLSPGRTCVSSQHAPGRTARLALILARFTGSHLLGGAGSREDPRTVPIEPPFVVAFLHVCSAAWPPTKHLIPKLRGEPGSERVRLPFGKIHWGSGAGGRARPANGCCLSPGQGPPRGEAPGTRWARGLRRPPPRCSPTRGSRGPATGTSHRCPRGRRAEEGAAAATWASAGARPASGPRWMVSKMIIENFEALKSWLSKTLEPM